MHPGSFLYPPPKFNSSPPKNGWLVGRRSFPIIEGWPTSWDDPPSGEKIHPPLLLVPEVVTRSRPGTASRPREIFSRGEFPVVVVGHWSKPKQPRNSHNVPMYQNKSTNKATNQHIPNKRNTKQTKPTQQKKTEWKEKKVHKTNAKPLSRHIWKKKKKTSANFRTLLLLKSPLATQNSNHRPPNGEDGHGDHTKEATPEDHSLGSTVGLMMVLGSLLLGMNHRDEP